MTMVFRMKRRVAWAVWAVLFIPFAYMSGVVMPKVQGEMARLSADPSCAVPLDLHVLGFEEAEVTALFECLGAAGREVYREATLREDAIYPITYAALLSFTIWALAGLAGAARWRVLMAFLPWVAVGFDLIENHNIVALIDAYPFMDARTVDMASLGNQLKWSFVFISVAVMLASAAIAAVRVVRGK